MSKKHSHSNEKALQDAQGKSGQRNYESEMKEYRNFLNEAEGKAQANFDKAILTLSGGGLGISMTFLKDFVPIEDMHGGLCLIFSWIAWGISLTCILYSFSASAQAMRKMISQVDNKTIDLETTAENLSQPTYLLNLASGIFFVAGLVFMSIFVWLNLP